MKSQKGVATVTLDRPDRMNALTQTMRKELIEIFGAADQDDSVRVVVVTGAGRPSARGRICPPAVPLLIGPSRRAEK